jgi:hypothetical protein
MGGAENTQAGPGGAGERAALVAKELAFGEGGRQRRTIDRDKRLLPARPEPLQKSSPNFFARACFAGDENRALDLSGTLGVMSNPGYGRVSANN